jgi:flagellar biosynthetic protein FliP
MTPVWNEVKQTSLDPYTASGSEMTWNEAWEAGILPVRSFMQKQIELAGNSNSIGTFYRYSPEVSLSSGPVPPPQSLDDVPLNVLLPAFMVSELKVAFLLGFQVFLPFLVLDLVVSSVTVSMGMLMLPPNMVSFPLKLILFVMVDGWNLVVGMLLQSFGPFG